MRTNELITIVIFESDKYPNSTICCTSFHIGKMEKFLFDSGLITSWPNGFSVYDFFNGQGEFHTLSRFCLKVKEEVLEVFPSLYMVDEEEKFQKLANILKRQVYVVNYEPNKKEIRQERTFTPR